MDPASPERRGRGRLLGLVGGGLAALLLAVVLITQLGGGDDAATSTNTAAQTSTDNQFVEPDNGTTGAAPAPIEPGDFAVFVLNGTQQNGIAAEVAGTLEADGYRSAGTGNATNKAVQATEVYFVEGKRRGALAVARKLDVAAANVKLAPSDISGQGPGADVVVQIGADKATP